METRSSEFSFETRAKAISRLKNEKFDFLVVGGGITGAAVARDAASRGLKVALVEKNDFAWGTSSRSSKLIHGGLRYLENMELELVFEALAERTFLLKSIPHLVRPLKFFMPVYRGDPHGKWMISMGLWLYDMLALLRAPGFHKRHSKEELKSAIPILYEGGLEGGFEYYDASMWDDVIVVETMRAAQDLGACVVNYTTALGPIRNAENRVTGYRVRDSQTEDDFEITACKTIICAGPWTDLVGKNLSSKWRNWLSPSKGIHLVFDLKKIPVPGAVVMSHPEDGRISFVIPREDYGTGVVIVGTTDGPTDENPENADVAKDDIEYLLKLLNKYFPDLGLSEDDIISTYVGVRPLMGAHASTAGSEGQSSPATSLQKVSREHFIGEGPGSTVVVAGGKYTTHRTMGEEIVDFTLKQWTKEARRGLVEVLPRGIRKKSSTKTPLTPGALPKNIQLAKQEAEKRDWKVPNELFDRYGADAIKIAEIHYSDQQKFSNSKADPDGFPYLSAQLRFCIRHGMVIHLSDFFFRRVALYLARKDHGLPWAEQLSYVWADELGKPEQARAQEYERLVRDLSG